MLLTSQTDVINLTTSTVADIDIQASWDDITTTTFTPGRTNTKFTSAKTDIIIGHPGASTQRQIKTIVIRNIHATTSNIISITHTDGSTSVTVYSRTLLAGEAVEYNGRIWQPFSAAGVPESTIVSPATDIQVFTTGGAGTWTPPTTFTPKFVHVLMWGGGGGGGAGASLATATVAKGGGGGGGGCFAERTFLYSDLGGAQSLNVGSAGTAGAQGAAGALGGDGGVGGNSTFGTTVRLTAYGGGGGRGGAISAAVTGGGGGGGCMGAGGTGTTSAGAQGAPAGAIPYVGGMGTPGPATVITTHVTEFGGGGGGGSTSAPLSCLGGSSLWGGGGGGSGSHHNATPAVIAGSAGGGSNSYTVGTGGGTGRDDNTLTVPTKGEDGQPGDSTKGGGGGGGGGSTTTASTAGGAGGAGGINGGGGGGGGVGMNPGLGGNGGAGGVGTIYVFSW